MIADRKLINQISGSHLITRRSRKQEVVIRIVSVSERISQHSAENAGATLARNRPVHSKDLDYNKDRVETFPASVSANRDTSCSHFPLLKCAVPPHKESKPFAIRVRGDSNKTRYRHKRGHPEQSRGIPWGYLKQFFPKLPAASANTTHSRHCNSAPPAIADLRPGNCVDSRQKPNPPFHSATKLIRRFQLHRPTKRCARQLHQSSSSTVAPPSRSTSSRRVAQERDREIASILQLLP